MKIACSSESFARSIESGELTQLEWLDACANELECDGAVFALAQFPRTDGEYLAQLKKVAADLGQSVAAVACDATARHRNDAFDIALALGAPLIVVPAPPAVDDVAAWGAFTAAVKDYVRTAKGSNVTLAVRNASGTLCPSAADLRRLAKDVDSAWLRYALDISALDADDVAVALAKTVITFATIDDVASFAQPGDLQAEQIIRRLARFRGFIVLEAAHDPSSPGAYHRAVERFTALRYRALATT